MLTLAFVLLGAGVLLGSVLGIFHLRPERVAPPWLLAALHGFVAVAGFACVALSLRGPSRGVEQGVG